MHGTDDIKTKTINAAMAIDRDERGMLTVNQFAQTILDNSTTRKRRNQEQQPQHQQQLPHFGILPKDLYI
jgi:hypothetical protein